jgi:hypothetical protein
LDVLVIKATPKFMRLANKHMAPDALQGLIDELVTNPEKGVLLRNTGGIRKIRWKTGKGGAGKSSGVRVLYYHEKKVIILLISLFKKSDKENIDDKEKNQLKKLLPELLRSYKNV